MKQIVVTCIVLVGLAASAPAADWPEWRGPNGNGVAGPGRYPTRFSPTEGVLWKARLPGKGGSTPIVWGDNIIITCGIGTGRQGQDGVLCFDWKGKLRWQQKLGPQVPGKHRNGSGAAPSAVTDGKYIVAYFKSGTVAGFDFQGTVLWKRNLQKEYGKSTLWWDLGTSPVLAGGKAVIAVMHAGESYVVAIDPATGKNAWKVDRTFRRPKESDQAYTTPLVRTEGGKCVIYIWGADHVTAHDPADGKVLWTCGGFNPSDKAMWRVIASPAASDGVAVVPYGRGGYLAAFKLGGRGDITATAHLWKKNFGADVPTPAADDGKVYHLTDKGTVVCMDIRTGREFWRTDLPEASGKFYSSLALAGDLLYMFRETGAGYVCRITPAGLKVLSRPDMADRIVAMPVPVNDKLLIRGNNYLYCIGE